MFACEYEPPTGPLVVAVVVAADRALVCGCGGCSCVFGQRGPRCAVHVMVCAEGTGSHADLSRAQQQNRLTRQKAKLTVQKLKQAVDNIEKSLPVDLKL